MLTDEEVDSLAPKILAFAIDEVSSWSQSYFHEIRATDDGELVPVYGAESPEGLGAFLCEFMPLATIKTIIRSCELSFDTFVIILTDADTGEKHSRSMSENMEPAARREAIEHMARMTSVHLIAFMRSRLSECVEEAVNDCGIISQAILAAVFSEGLIKAGVPATADAREEIEKAAARAANRRRERLLEHIQGLPHLITTTRRGAPPKSDARRQHDRAAYEAKIEAAYRKLRLEQGRPPTKRSVATELGEGGKNLAGGDSRNNALNVKLGRLGINYKELIEKIERELQQ
jgi:hypothetical protein